MKIIEIVLTLIVLILFGSCSPLVTTKLIKSYPALEMDEAVKVIELEEDEPDSSVYLGDVSVDDAGFSVNCTYDQVIDKAKTEARKAGGNAIKIISHKKPSLLSGSCHRIAARILRLHNGYDTVPCFQVINIPTGEKFNKADLLPEKGRLYINVSFPEGNFIRIKNKTGYNNYFGFLGITSELGYYYSKHSFISIGGGGLMDFMLPLPAPIDWEGEHEIAGGSFLQLSNGHHFGRFAFNYGLNFSRNNYRHLYLPKSYFVDSLITGVVDSTEYHVTENRYGLMFRTKFMINPYFQFGVKYLPSFIDADDFNFGNYSHFLFFDLIINFNMKIGRRKNILLNEN